MRLLIALAIFANGCTTSNGDPCVPDRSGLVAADWVVAQVLAEAVSAGVEVCFLDQQVRRARLRDCQHVDEMGVGDQEQLADCINRAAEQDWTDPQQRACLDVMASAPCEALEDGPCAIGEDLAPTCYE